MAQNERLQRRESLKFGGPVFSLRLEGPPGKRAESASESTKK